MDTTTKRSKRGLDADVPQVGTSADAYNVACTALVLHWADERTKDREGYGTARHAVTLHRISGRLHRIAERLCNEDLTCPRCGGDGRISWESKRTGPSIRDCRACAGHGTTVGRQLERLREDAREIATHYGLRAHFQTDPRGCALYLIDPASVPDGERFSEGKRAEGYIYPSDPPEGPPLATLQARWIDANYDRGHAVVRLGR